jgi:hypothetical protein
MIPRSYPSVYDSPNGRTNMVVAVLEDVNGLSKWIDYIPVKEVEEPAKINSYNLADAMSVTVLDSVVNKKKWIDYVPVFAVESGVVWSTGNSGYIPVTGLIAEE